MRAQPQHLRQRPGRIGAVGPDLQDTRVCLVAKLLRFIAAALIVPQDRRTDYVPVGILEHLRMGAGGERNRSNIGCRTAGRLQSAAQCITGRKPPVVRILFAPARMRRRCRDRRGRLADQRTITSNDADLERACTEIDADEERIRHGHARPPRMPRRCAPCQSRRMSFAFGPARNPSLPGFKRLAGSRASLIVWSTLRPAPSSRCIHGFLKRPAP